MTTYDLVIRHGQVHDGRGLPTRELDIGISAGMITAIEPALAGRGREEINAQGCIVTPGFIDMHTHYDGQALWSSHMMPSSNHGVTTVLMGNCGVGFAPCHSGKVAPRSAQRHAG